MGGAGGGTNLFFVLSVIIRSLIYFISWSALLPWTLFESHLPWIYLLMFFVCVHLIWVPYSLNWFTVCVCVCVCVFVCVFILFSMSFCVCIFAKACNFTKTNTPSILLLQWEDETPTKFSKRGEGAWQGLHFKKGGAHENNRVVFLGGGGCGFYIKKLKP